MLYRQHYMHNEQARINCLPSEILSCVFVYLMDPPTRLPHPGPERRIEIPPSTGEWSRASLVCRYWRQVALSTPELWTMIQVLPDDTEGLGLWPWASVALSRSGVLPIRLHTYVEDIPEEDMSRLVDEAHRIKELWFIRHIDSKYLEPLFAKALQLETLLLTAEDNYPTSEEFPCQFLHLRALSISHHTIWRSWSMRELRHLSLVKQKWRSADVRPFFVVLEVNAHLEELFLDRISFRTWEDWENASAFLEDLPPVPLTKLKRLLVHDDLTNVNTLTPMIATVHKKLKLPADCTRLNVLWPALTHDRHDGFDRRDAYPVQRLFVNANSLIGTDGISVCIIRRGEPDQHSLRSIHLSQVRELWLDIPVCGMGTPNFAALGFSAILAVKQMQSVTKLTLLRESSIWMDYMEDSFPALTELHIFTQYCPDGPAIVRFLASRKQRDLQVDTLRFFGDPASQHCQDFVKWRENSQEFLCHVGRVVFEETSFYSEEADLLSEWFGIPEACETPSPVSDVWKPWRTFSR